MLHLVSRVKGVVGSCVRNGVGVSVNGVFLSFVPVFEDYCKTSKFHLHDIIMQIFVIE